MLKENPTAAATQQTIVVLILILMEHAQRDGDLHQEIYVE